MSASKDTLRPTGWNVNSVYVPKRDGPARIEQAYRILLGGEVVGNGPVTERSKLDARRDLCSGVNGSSGETA
jgi:hypothetical protein